MLVKQRQIASLMSFVAALRGDLTTAHAWADREGEPKLPAESETRLPRA